MKKAKIKVPGYAKGLEEVDDAGLGEGLKEVKESKEDDSLFEYNDEKEEQQDQPVYPQEVQEKID